MITSDMFQFLIGTLQTRSEILRIRRIFLFQFLIGTLQTAYKLDHPLKKSRFQFLIGTLQTEPLLLCFCDQNLVSIPYRYATNSVCERIGVYRNESFNSL